MRQIVTNAADHTKLYSRDLHHEVGRITIEAAEIVGDCVVAHDLEGIVAKRKDSAYSAGTPWLKIKNPRYSQGDIEPWKRKYQ